MMRLDKYISGCGLASRRETALAVRRGEVKINGVCAVSPDVKLDENADTVEFCGETVVYRRFVWLMLNKPKGVISATEDGRGQRTVLDLLPEQLRRMDVFPCGRLDADTTGLMLLTNDGELAHRLLAPKNHVAKRYAYKAARQVTDEEAENAAKGILLSDGYKCLPAQIERGEGYCGVITICEGKYHQIKRMFGAQQNRITDLRRISFGGIELPENLAPGEWRYLTEEELRLLYSLKSTGNNAQIVNNP